MFPTSKSLFPNFSPTTETSKNLKRPFPFPWDHQNPSQEDPPFFLHFPSPFLDDHQDTPLSQIFSQQIAPRLGNNNSISPTTTTTTTTKGVVKEEMGVNSKKKKLGSTSRRRTGKKDRHSKICTAQGVRDRRMRLSLQIARKFFDLQDMLGFDKASATIEWLLSKSKTAIKELTAPKITTNNGSISEEGNKSESECEVASSMEENNSNNNVEVGKDKSVIIKKKESREKARARARERTKEKMMIKKQNNTGQINMTGASNIFNESSLNPIITTTFLDQESNNSYTTTTQENSSTSPHEGLESHFANVGITEKYFGVGRSTATMFEYHDDLSSGAVDSTISSFMGFLGNWEFAPFSGNPISGSSINYLATPTSLDDDHDFQPVVDQEKHFSCKQY